MDSKVWVVPHEDDVRQESGPRVVVRDYGGEFDVYVDGWRVNSRRYTTRMGADRRVARALNAGAR